MKTYKEFKRMVEDGAVGIGSAGPTNTTVGVSVGVNDIGVSPKFQPNQPKSKQRLVSNTTNPVLATLTRKLFHGQISK
jgi:hypothetical protein